MGASAPRTFRIPLLLVAAANLAVLGKLLWPWREAAHLPVNGTTALDPAITLLAYLGLIYWISSGITEPTRKALSIGAGMGLLSGLVFAGWVVLAARGEGQPNYFLPSLLGLAVILWGIAGLRGTREVGHAGMGALAGLWGAMLGGLIACAAILAELFLVGPPPASPDPWKQYEGLAIGNAATQGLVHALNTATAFLLVGPLVGAAAGLLFGFFGGAPKN